MWHAYRRRRFRAFHYILRKGAPWNQPDDNGDRLYEIAFLAREWDVVDMFLKAGLKLNREGGLLRKVICNGTLEDLEDFLELGGCPNTTSGRLDGEPLHLYIALVGPSNDSLQQRLEKAKMLLDYGCDIDNIDGYELTTLGRIIWIGRYFHGEYFHTPCRIEGSTLVSVIKFLSENGADSNAGVPRPLFSILTKIGFGRRHEEAEYYLEALRLLINAGAKVNCTEGGLTPLCTALYHGNFKAVKLLLRAGADVHLSRPNSGLPSALEYYRGLGESQIRQEFMEILEKAACGWNPLRHVGRIWKNRSIMWGLWKQEFQSFRVKLRWDWKFGFCINYIAQYLDALLGEPEQETGITGKDLLDISSQVLLHDAVAQPKYISSGQLSFFGIYQGRIQFFPTYVRYHSGFIRARDAQ